LFCCLITNSIDDQTRSMKVTIYRNKISEIMESTSDSAPVLPAFLRPDRNSPKKRKNPSMDDQDRRYLDIFIQRLNPRAKALGPNQNKNVQIQLVKVSKQNVFVKLKNLSKKNN
jgi:hypothetical protein